MVGNTREFGQSAVALLLVCAVPYAVAAEPAPPTAAAAATKSWGKLTSTDGKQAFALSGAEAVVGSDAATCQVVLADRTVSPQHAKLSFQEGTVTVEDLGSKLGTLAAGTMLKKGKPFRILQPMPLSFGALTLQFEFGERPALLPPTQAPAKPPKKGKAPPVAAPSKAGKPGPKSDSK